MIASSGDLLTGEIGMQRINTRDIAAHLSDLRLRGLSTTYLYAREHHLLRLAAHLAPVPLRHATPAMLAAWRQRTAHLSTASAATYTAHARQFYAWALETGRITEDPARRLPSPRKPRRLPRPICETALMDALAHAPARIRLWLVLAGWAGLRAKEIALLRAENVHLSGPHPYLLVASGATKGNDERKVPLCPFAVAELRAARLPLRGWVFHRCDGRPGPNTPARVSMVAAAYLHSLGYTDTLHQLRHRFGTMAYQAGGHDLRAVQELMGHKRPETTALYTAAADKATVAAVLALPVPRPPRRRGPSALPPAA